jgi:hypothetical protein
VVHSDTDASAPHRPASEATEDPYATIALAIVHRAWRDATGHCDSPGHSTPEKIRSEAIAWLQDEDTVTELLELAGFDADLVLRRLRGDVALKAH